MAAISLGVILLSAPAIFYGEVVWRKEVAWYASGWSSGVPASWPLTVLFLLGVAGSLPILRRWGLTRRELLAVYCVVLVTTPLFSIGVLFWALSQPISYYYFGQVYPQWQPVFLDLIPTWFSPSSSAAVDGYFLGRSTVPWSEWVYRQILIGASRERRALAGFARQTRSPALHLTLLSQKRLGSAYELRADAAEHGRGRWRSHLS